MIPSDGKPDIFLIPLLQCFWRDAKNSTRDGRVPHCYVPANMHVAANTIALPTIDCAHAI